MSEPNALVGRSAGGAIQDGWAASALLVRQIPPPAAATHNRHGAPDGADALPQLGSIASAVTRPDSCVDGPVCVAGSKNWPDSPGTLGVTGPSARHAPGVVLTAAWKARCVLKAFCDGRCDLASKALPPCRAIRSST